jgi:hypothetical protein
VYTPIRQNLEESSFASFSALTRQGELYESLPAASLCFLIYIMLFRFLLYKVQNLSYPLLFCVHLKSLVLKRLYSQPAFLSCRCHLFAVTTISAQGDMRYTPVCGCHVPIGSASSIFFSPCFFSSLHVCFHLLNSCFWSSIRTHGTL